jgi:hypothetical protein
MKTETNKEKENFLSKISEDLEHNISEHITDFEDIKDFEDLQEELENNDFFDVIIIYYKSALIYLQENDASLYHSLEIANEYGYKLENLNSEVLASLHASQSLRNDFYELEDEITEFFTNLNN